MKLPKNIFLDIDGTVKNYGSPISPTVKKALKDAKQNGHIIFFATGRSKNLLPLDELEGLDIDGFVCSSGALIIHNGKEVFNSTMSERDLAFLREKLKAVNAPSIFNTSDCLYSTDEELAYIRRIYTGANIPKAVSEPFLNAVETKKKWEPDSVEKLIYFESGMSIEEMNDYLNGAYHIDGYSFGGALHGSGEIIPLGISKAESIKRIEKMLNLDHSNTIAIGDGGNDVEMLKYAPCGIAMGNAKAYIKAAADVVCDSVENDGVARAFESLGII